jgi:hypothetical protein
MPMRHARSAYAGPIPRRVVPTAAFHGPVQRDVIRHDDVSVLADPDPVNLDAAAGEHVQLADECGGIDDHAIADNRGDVRIQHARRHEVELEDLLAEHDRMAGVVAALIADNGRDVLGQKVRRLPLAFVAPLQTDDHCGGHLALPQGQPQGCPVLAPAAIHDRTPGN